MLPGLPHYASGQIIRGFGRGSKELGIPTANFPVDVVKGLSDEIQTGIYFGWAKVCGTIYKMVISIGWNPYYKNKQKSMETHILHKFDGDLYGEVLQIIMIGYLRPEKNFETLEALVEAIQNDIQTAKELLNEEKYLQFKNDPYFQK